MAKAPKVGSQSPWGPIQDVDVIVPGKIWNVSTARHGGIKVSRGIQNQIPKVARRRGGWYEEDVDWSIIGMLFGEAFTSESVDAAHKTMKSWLPDEYRALTGEEVASEDSYIMKQRRLKAKHRNDWVAVAAWGSWHEAVPPGMVGVVATLGGKRGGKERYFLVGENRYEIGPIGYVIDEAKDIEVKPFA